MSVHARTHAETHVRFARAYRPVLVRTRSRSPHARRAYMVRRHARKAERVCERYPSESRTWRGRRVGVTCTYTRYTHSLTGFYTARLPEDQASILRRNTPVPADPKSRRSAFFLPLSLCARCALRVAADTLFRCILRRQWRRMKRRRRDVRCWKSGRITRKI